MGLLARACASVLQITKLTSRIPWLYMKLTALLPPPPTPITLMMDVLFPGISKLIKSSFILLVFFPPYVNRADQLHFHVVVLEHSGKSVANLILKITKQIARHRL